MQELDREYFQGRAEQELELARNAASAKAARAHSVMADHYLDLVQTGTLSQGAATPRHARPIRLTSCFAISLSRV